MHIIYSFDDNYARHAGISLMSLFDTHRHIENLDVILVTNHVSPDNRERIDVILGKYGRTTKYVEMEPLLKGIEISTNFNLSAYGRIFADEITDTEKALYIDSDTIICSPLDEVWQMSMGENLVNGVLDTVNPYHRINAGIPLDAPYVCAGGILALNLKLWRKENLRDKFLNYIYRFNGNPPLDDQGTINAVCRGRIGTIPLRYNVMPPIFKFTSHQLKELFKLNRYYSQEEICDAIKNPAVIHFTREFFNRPWFTNCTHPMKEKYLKYLRISPWSNMPLNFGKLSLNCRIQNAVYRWMPYTIYKLMIQFIEWRHK